MQYDHKMARVRSVEDRQWKAVITILVIVFFVEKEIAAFFFISSDTPLAELGFGFGRYIFSIMSNGTYAACNARFCDFSTRMPVIPLFLSAVGLFADDQLVAALVKNAIISMFFYLILVFLIESFQLERRILVKTSIWVLGAMCIFPPVIKHFSALTYEEGFIGELLVLLTLSYLAILECLAKNNEETYKYASINILLATFIFLTKASMVVLSLVSAALCIYAACKCKGKARTKLVSFMLISFAAIGSWGLHNAGISGRLNFMTSWDGQNLYRGWNNISPEIYPDVSLDRLFDTRDVILRNGTHVIIPKMPARREFVTEFAWNDFYRNLSVEWIRSNPVAALNFFTKKCINFFLSYEKTPYTASSDARPQQRALFSEFENVSICVWLVFGRLMQVFLVLGSYRYLIKRPSDGDAFMVVGVFLLLTSYAVPYVVGFNYERHITPFLLIVICCYVFLCERSATENHWVDPEVSICVSSRR